MKILLCVTGSISAYKSYDLCRNLVKAGHKLKVVLSRGALEFIQPNTFKYLGAEVFHPDEDFKHSGVLHVDLARWADRFVTAPLSANKLSDFCQGRANDLINSIFLALDPKTPKLFFPAMNTFMLTHAFVEENLKKLATLPNTKVFGTSSGELVCGEQGEGKLLPVEVIHDCIEAISFNSSKEHILISTGATIAPLDPVRYLTNPSSGITGYYLAKEALKKGHQVTVIAGQFATSKLEQLTGLDRFQLYRVKTTEDMYQKVHEVFPQATSYYSSAAISDFEFNMEEQKIKKNQFENALPYKKAKDVLKSILEVRAPHQKVIGFAAETNLDEAMLQQKFTSKPVDLLVGTKVHSGLGKDSLQGFQNDHAHYLFYNAKGIQYEGTLSKTELAAALFDLGKYD